MPAPKGNKNAVGNPGGGRKTLYTKDHPKMAMMLCRMGATDADLAREFEVSVSTIEGWKRDHVEFFDALKEGKAFADARVAQSLFERATGYEHPEDDIRTVTLPGVNAGSEIVITPTIKRYAPDTTAAIFWLKNRQPKVWRDKVETELSGTVSHLYDPEQAKRMAEMLLRKKGGE